jgi:hypothetical protein
MWDIGALYLKGHKYGQDLFWKPQEGSRELKSGSQPPEVNSTAQRHSKRQVSFLKEGATTRLIVIISRSKGEKTLNWMSTLFVQTFQCLINRAIDLKEWLPRFTDFLQRRICQDCKRHRNVVILGR